MSLETEIVRGSHGELRIALKILSIQTERFAETSLVSLLRWWLFAIPTGYIAGDVRRYIDRAFSQVVASSFAVKAIDLRGARLSCLARYTSLKSQLGFVRQAHPELLDLPRDIGPARTLPMSMKKRNGLVPKGCIVTRKGKGTTLIDIIGQ